MPTLLRSISRFVRLILLTVWATIIITAVAFYFADPSKFTATNIAGFINSFGNEIWLIYFAMSVLRGFTLLPSTPLVLAGTFLYPNQPWLVLATALTGIIISSALIYFGSETLGFADYFETKKPNTVHRIKHRLEQPAGLIFVGFWAFFPLVPTDAVCYVAGMTKMNFPRFILAVFIGEVIICSIYVFSGGFAARNWL